MQVVPLRIGRCIPCTIACSWHLCWAEVEETPGALASSTIRAHLSTSKKKGPQGQVKALIFGKQEPQSLPGHSALGSNAPIGAVIQALWGVLG